MLKPRKKLSKKALKEDKFIETTYKAQEFAKEYGKYLGYGVISLIILITAVTLYVNSKRNAEITASSEVSKIEQFYINKDYTTAISEFSRISNNFKGTRGGGKALFYLANCYFETKDYENAKTSYQSYVDDYGDNQDITSSAYAGVAACFEETGDYRTAAEWYLKAADKYSSCFLTPENLLDAGRCNKILGDQEEAKKVLNRLIKDYPDASIIEEAKGLLAQL